MMDFVSTGISGFDRLLGGGLARGSTALLIGPVGTLKSYIALHFIYAGLEAGEKCLYISTLESQRDLEDQIKLNFGWDLKPFLNGGALRFKELKDLWLLEREALAKPAEFKDVVGEIYSAVRDVGGGRVVVNNVSHLFNFSEDHQSVVRAIGELKLNLKASCATALLVMDEGCVDKHLEESIKTICDYVLKTEVSGIDRRITVSKSILRHGLEWHRLLLTDKGVEIEVVR